MSEDFRGVFAASMSVLKADLSLDIEATISHAKKNLDENGVGSAFFGSTGAGQLIGIRMKKEFISHLGNYDQYMGKLGNSLSTTVNHYNTAHKELNKLDKDVLQITDKPIGIEPISLEKPNRAD